MDFVAFSWGWATGMGMMGIVWGLMSEKQPTSKPKETSIPVWHPPTEPIGVSHTVDVAMINGEPWIPLNTFRKIK